MTTTMNRTTEAERAFSEEIDRLRTAANNYIASGPELGPQVQIASLKVQRDRAQRAVRMASIVAAVMTAAAIVGWLR